MRNRLRMTWRSGVAMTAIVATALFVGTPTAMAQGPYTETVAMPAGTIGMPAGAIGIPSSGAVQISGPDGGPSLNAVHVDDHDPGISTGGSYAVPVGPGCLVETVGNGRGRHEASNSGCEGGMVFTGEAPIYP